MEILRETACNLSGWLFTGPRFETGTLQIRSRVFCARKTSVQRRRNLPSFSWLVSSQKILCAVWQNFVFRIHIKIFGVNLILFLCLILQMKRISVQIMNYFIGTRRKITSFEEFISAKMILWSSWLWHRTPEACTVSVFRVERGTNTLDFITCKTTMNITLMNGMHVHWFALKPWIRSCNK